MKAVLKRLWTVILALAIALTFMPALPVYAVSGDDGYLHFFEFSGQQLPDGKGDGILFSTTQQRNKYKIQKALLDTLVTEEGIDNLGTKTNPKYDIDKNGVWDFDTVTYSNGDAAFRLNRSSKIFTKSMPITISTNYFMEHELEQYVETVFFYFNQRDLDDASVTVGNVWYTGLPVYPTIKLVLDGETLKEGRDYTVEYYNNEEAGKDVGSAYIVGERRFIGGMTVNFTIKPRSLTSAKVTCKAIPSLTWNGKARNPAVKATFGGVPLQKGTDYTVQYKYNVNVGQARVILKGKGNFTGTKTLYFKIKPKTTTISKLTGDKGSFTVKWHKRTEKMSKSQISGYQIQYSKKSDFSTASSVKVTLKNKSGSYITAKKVKGLSKGKYYVRIRTYKRITTSTGTKTFYSNWRTYKSPVTVK